MSQIIEQGFVYTLMMWQNHDSQKIEMMITVLGGVEKHASLETLFCVYVS